MKIEYPEKILVRGDEIDIIFDKNKKDFQSSGSFCKRKIIIGISNLKQRDMCKFSTFLHEVLEMILVAYWYRHDRDGDKLFFFNHKQYSDIVQDLAMALKDIKIE